MATTKKCGGFVNVETWFTTSPEQLRVGEVRPLKPTTVVVRRGGKIVRRRTRFL